MGKDVIIACDFSSKEDCLNFLKKFKDESLFLKIGMELFYATGPSIVKEIKDIGHKVFLDLKLHDIPNTVMKSMKVLSSIGADMTNVHAGGTIKMMQGALKGLESENKQRPLLIAVTQLTSTDQESMQKDLLINSPIEDVVAHYALNTKKAGLDGVVCSPLEVEKIKSVCGKDFITVTPGIRFADGEVGDQARIATPANAKKWGSDYIVVGRPITQAEDPVKAYKQCVSDFVD